MDDKDKIFYMVCRHCCSIMDGWIPYPSTIIHYQMPHLSLYKVRKYLKELKQEGLVDSGLYVDQGEERPILIRGWLVTKAGQETEAFKKAYARERQLCAECFGFDIGESYKDLNTLSELEAELGII